MITVTAVTKQSHPQQLSSRLGVLMGYGVLGKGATSGRHRIEQNVHEGLLCRQEGWATLPSLCPQSSRGCLLTSLIEVERPWILPSLEVNTPSWVVGAPAPTGLWVCCYDQGSSRPPGPSLQLSLCVPLPWKNSHFCGSSTPSGGLGHWPERKGLSTVQRLGSVVGQTPASLAPLRTWWCPVSPLPSCVPPSTPLFSYLVPRKSRQMQETVLGHPQDICLIKDEAL